MKKLFYFASVAALALSSCTKDSTEIAPVQTGEAAFSAYMEVGSTTRHHMQPTTDANGKVTYPFIYDAGDMVAVNSDTQNNKNLPFITVQGGSPAVFTAAGTDISYLGTTGTYYMTYPWCDKTSVTPASEQVDYATINGVSVPAEQRYAKNSFATMTAPAFMVAAAEDVTASQVLGFKSVASYFQVPVTGVGNLKKLALNIGNQGLHGDVVIKVYADEDDAPEDAQQVGDYYYEIEYAETVQPSTGEEGLTQEGNAPEEGNTTVTVDFGSTPLELDPVEATNVVFVINAGIALEDQEITYTATLVEDVLDEDGEVTGVKATAETYTYTYPTWAEASNQVIGLVENQWDEIAANMLFFGKPATFGVSGYPVNNAVDFITWAYVNWNMNYSEETDNTVNTFEYRDAAVEAGILKLEVESQGNDVNADVYTFQPAMLLANLDFAQVSDTDAATALQKAALAWFKENKAQRGAMIPTLKGAKIIGNDFEMANLEVAGDAFMADAASKTHSGISNVTLKNFSIEAAEDATRVNFFLKNHSAGTDIEDVTIDGGSLNGGKATATKHIVHNSYATTFEELAVSTYPVAGEDDAPYTYNFYMNDDADLSDIYAGNANAITNLVGSEAGAVAVVNEVEGVVENVMQAVEMPVREKWFSVVIDEVSYWTGATALSVRSAANEEDVYGAYYTAEELMRHREHNGASTMTLTNDIDFRNIAIGYTGYADIVNTVVGNNKTISNVNITNKVVATDGTVSYNVAKEGQNYALFGHTADIKDLNVDGLNVDVQVGADWAVVSGLSYYGEAENVSVINGVVSLTGSKDFNIKWLRTAFGVVFGKANAADIKNVYVKANIVNGIDIPTMTMSAVGLVAGELTVADDTEIAAGYSGGVNGTKAISMWKSGSFDATKLYTTDKDGKVTGPAANIYSGKLFGTVKVTGIPESTTEKHIRDFHVVAPANAPEGWVNPITEKSSKAYAQHIAGGFTFDVLNEDFHLDINFYDGAYEQDLAYVKPVAEEE